MGVQSCSRLYMDNYRKNNLHVSRHETLRPFVSIVIGWTHGVVETTHMFPHLTRLSAEPE